MPNIRKISEPSRLLDSQTFSKIPVTTQPLTPMNKSEYYPEMNKPTFRHGLADGSLTSLRVLTMQLINIG